MMINNKNDWESSRLLIKFKVKLNTKRFTSHYFMWPYAGHIVSQANSVVLFIPTQKLWNMRTVRIDNI